MTHIFDDHSIGSMMYTIYDFNGSLFIRYMTLMIFMICMMNMIEAIIEAIIEVLI